MKDIARFRKDVEDTARWLSHGNVLLAEELQSAMYIALLDMKECRSSAYYRRSARNRAIDYLRRTKHYSRGEVIEHISLEALQEAGFQIDTTGRMYAPSGVSTDSSSLTI